MAYFETDHSVAFLLKNRRRSPGSSNSLLIQGRLINMPISAAQNALFEEPFEQRTSAALPLCVDMDGTLIRTDTFFESLFRLLRKHPGFIWQIPALWRRGRAYVKQ